MEKEKAFKIVYEELKKVPMFMGKFDAINGNENFMFGVCAVMEYITSQVNEPTYEEFSIAWVTNIFQSYDNAKQKEGK